MMNTLGTAIQWTPEQTSSLTPLRNELCERCGASLVLERISLREALLNLVCGCLLLSILIATSCFIGRWIDDRVPKLFDLRGRYESFQLVELISKHCTDSGVDDIHTLTRTCN
jgi:hypothetical protein